MIRIPIAVFSFLLLGWSTPVVSNELDQQLYEAVNSFDSNAVGSLIDDGADPNSFYATGLTPLMRAVEVNQVEIVRLLLEKGANPNLQDGSGRSTAEIAIDTDNAEIVEVLLADGANFDVTDYYGTPLVFRVVGSGSENMHAIVSVMGKHGVNMNLGTSSQTPLDYSVEQNDVETVKLLLEAGADPNIAAEGGGSPVASAIYNTEILELLLSAGADPNIVDRYGDPILFQALFSVSTEAAEALINAGANVNQPGSDGRTALTRARDGGAEDIVAFLQTQGAMDDPQEQAPSDSSSVNQLADDSVPGHGDYPRMADLPVYPGAETMFMLDEETHSANHISSDPLPQVAEKTEALLLSAGWGDANHPHAKTVDDRYYKMFVRDQFLLVLDIAIAKAMDNQTAITYNIMPLNSSFGRMIGQ